MTTSNIETSFSVTEVNAVYQKLLNGFYQLSADKLATIPMSDREFAARENTIAFFRHRGITITEEELLAILN